jgi:hypothetical protein
VESVDDACMAFARAKTIPPCYYVLHHHLNSR